MRDITKSKKAEQVLHRSREQLEQLVREHTRNLELANAELQSREQTLRQLGNNLPIAICITESDGRISEFNKRAIELWGRTPESDSSDDRYCGAHQLLKPDGSWLTHEQSPMARALETGNAVLDEELIIERPDGSRRFVVANIIPRMDANGNLVGAINCMTDVTESKEAEREIRNYSEALQSLSHHLAAMQETERSRLHSELHDKVGQTLTALGLNLDLLRDWGESNAPDRIRQRITDSLSLLEATNACITDVMAELHPPLLDDLGLTAALNSFVLQFEARTGVKVTMHSRESGIRLHSEREIALYRIATEALNNIAKHANATTGLIKLSTSDKHFRLEIRDDGNGFDQEQVNLNSRWGMMTMRERARSIGGTLEIESEPNRGTTVVVDLEVGNEHHGSDRGRSFDRERWAGIDPGNQ